LIRKTPWLGSISSLGERRRHLLDSTDYTTNRIRRWWPHERQPNARVGHPVREEGAEGAAAGAKLGELAARDEKRRKRYL